MRYAVLLVVIAGTFSPSGASAVETPVKVERAAPVKESLPTLRFLRENRDFLRRSVDALRVVPLERSAEGAALDPKVLSHAALLDSALADLDTLTAKAEEAALLASIAELGRLEAEIDRLEALLVDQNGRLETLEADYLGRQETALVLVLRGAAVNGSLPDSLWLKDGFGDTHHFALAEAEQAALRAGGIVEVVRAFVEPRAQTWELALGGGAWSRTPAYLGFEPARNRLTFMVLDLTSAQPESGASLLHASAWTDEAPAPAGGQDAGSR